MTQSWQKLTILVVTISWITAQPAWSDGSPVADPIYSEPFCLKIFEEVVEKARSSSWQISDRDRHILTQCRAKFPPVINTQTRLPTASECLDVVKTLVQGGLSKVKEIELPEEQVRSISRCDEIVQYYSLPLANMLPTLKPNDRIVVDKTAYQTRSPQRGDIIVFNAANSTNSTSSAQSEKASEPSTQRAIGLPGETVTIKQGRVYVNGKPIREDYITPASTIEDRSIKIPANNYFVLGDNRHNILDLSAGKLVSRNAIVGKVIWHFGSK
jgi:signal peptidase I